ncbi:MULTISPECIES: ROK family protein [Protofrankia]|uniref:ROK family protein n=1 Tax=Candidatus Protofrankia datiscae TaxID=2716812 RepID=F8B1E0_9ACTN|nr:MULTISPECIES: ROK family protein [Protofrankia]AEH09809.1 ROK family protein [Candidatus Protofrankia datiscae]
MTSHPTVGIDIGGTKLLMLAHRPGHDEPLTVRVATGPGATPGGIGTAIEKFLADHGLAPVSVGIAVPGLVEDGRVAVCDVLPALNGWPGPAGLAAPHLLVNDIRAALAEEAADIGDARTAVVMLSGTAVGSAYLHQGRVVRGGRGWAGEVGSMPVPTPRGVRRLDELAGGASIVQAAGLPPAQVRAALAAGNPAIRGVVEAAGDAFGLAMATLLNILNPDVLRVGGGTLNYPGYWNAALVTARARTLPELWAACTVARIQVPDLVVARGAARLAAASAAGAPWPAQYL